MLKSYSLKIPASQAVDDSVVRQHIAAMAGVGEKRVTGYHILKRSIDARSKQPFVILNVEAFIDEPFHDRERLKVVFQDVHKATKQVVIIGAGPCGLFAALKLLERGIKPVILERGKDVRARRRDLALLNKQGMVNPESNYCFGEGGAGTYSDGKLYTRSSKRGDVNRILNLFVQFGAEENILFDAHPHIGTNKLPQIITAMRAVITGHGGEFHFEKKVTGFQTEGNKILEALTADGGRYAADSFILATGHSARDIFLKLHENGVKIESKPFALGVRVEHPQSLIDSMQYHLNAPAYVSKGNLRPAYLPPASYSLVQQVDGKGVFSFCMCPGGIIAPAATSPGELVVNGWSPSKRNNPYANSGIVVSVEEKDLGEFSKHGPLAGMYFQQAVEQRAFEMGGGKFVAPAQRLVDFTNSKLSQDLPDCSYLPGIHSAQIKDVLPKFVNDRLKEAFKEFGRKMPAKGERPGYFTNEAVVVATESRTSSPVRIPRDQKKLHHPQFVNLFPAGEGAGYAGGIVSAGMDGERVGEGVCLRFEV